MSRLGKIVTQRQVAAIITDAFLSGKITLSKLEQLALYKAKTETVPINKLFCTVLSNPIERILNGNSCKK